MSREVSRRQFLKSMGTAALGLTAAACSPVLGTRSCASVPNPGLMPMRSFGSSGSNVSLLGLGGQGRIERGDSLSVDIINDAIDRGVNFLDTSPRYSSGTSESTIGNVMEDRRSEVFLATKSHLTTYTGVMNDFEGSLERLRTEYVDLYQVHNIGTESDVAALFTPDSSGRTAIDAFARIRDEGRARFIGITGHHDPAQLLTVMNHPAAPAFDAIQLALNPADRHQKPFQEQLVPAAIERKMAVIAMKVSGRQAVFNDGLTMADCLNYVYSFPVSCALVGISRLWQVEADVAITQAFSEPLTAEQMKALEDVTEGQTADKPPRSCGDWFKVERYG